MSGGRLRGKKGKIAFVSTVAQFLNGVICKSRPVEGARSAAAGARSIRVWRLVRAAAVVCACAAVCAAGVLQVRALATSAPGVRPRIALVIDDFGQDRRGVAEMLELPADITVAVMPFMEYSRADAEAAHNAGKEVIVHMPFQAGASDPMSWYGPRPLLLTYGEEKAYQLTLEAIDDVPFAAGLNVHVGGKSTEKPEIVRGVVAALKSKDMYFLDSYTSMKSVCLDVSVECGVPCLRRDVFLEHGSRTTAHITAQLKKAVDIARRTGQCVVIGHVGPEGGVITANAIRAMLGYIEESGVEIVRASTLAYNQ